MRALFKLLAAYWTAKAASRGPSALAKREVRRRAHRALRRTLR